MKPVTLFILIIFFYSCLNPKKQGIKTENKIGSAFTQIEFDTLMHDFGVVKAGEVLLFSFPFKNSGDNDLIISKAEGDCGCVDAKFPVEAVKPGEKGAIEIKFDSSGMIGKQLKTIEIQSNSKEPKQLIIFATVENDLLQLNSKN